MKEVQGRYWTYFGDNSGVNGSMLNKSSASLRTFDSSLVIGRTVLEAAINRSCLHTWRVEPDSKPADEPSRNAEELMEKRGAIFKALVVSEHVLRPFSKASPSKAPGLVGVEPVIACG